MLQRQHYKSGAQVLTRAGGKYAQHHIERVQLRFWRRLWTGVDDGEQMSAQGRIIHESITKMKAHCPPTIIIGDIIPHRIVECTFQRSHNVAHINVR